MNSIQSAINQTFVGNYIPLTMPQNPLSGYTFNYGSVGKNLVPWSTSRKSQLDDLIYISKNPNAAQNVDPYLWNHWLQFSTDNTPAAGQIL